MAHPYAPVNLNFGLLPNVATDWVITAKIKPEVKSQVIDDALTLCEHGKFHWALLAIAGLSFLAVSCEFTTHAYILPFAECDLNISATQMGFINASFLAGSLISSLFWGLISDTVGRRRVLTFGLIGQGTLTIIASWSICVEMFIALRTGTGFMCGSAATVLLTYVGEFCSDKRRPTTICILGFCWILSWWIIPALSWGIMDLKINWDLGFMVYRSWRLFITLIGIPGVISGILLSTLPESPKFYLAKGKEEETLRILQYIYHKNTGNPKEKYPITKLLTSKDTIENSKLSPSSPEGLATFISLFWKMIGQLKLIFTRPLRKNFLLSSGVYSSGMFGYYSLGLWLPELLKRFDSHYNEFPDADLTICELAQLSINSTTSKNIDCTATPDISLYTNTFIMGGASLLGNLIAVLLSNKVPARLLTGAYFLSGGISAICIYFIQSRTQNIIFAAIFMSAGNAGMSVHNATAINLFPTHIRSIGICVNFLFGRISAVLASVIFGMLIEVNCAVPIMMAGVVYFLGVLCCLSIPESSKNAIE